MKSNQQFGPALRGLRIKAGFTQRDLAKRAGVDVSYLSKIENGKLPPSEAVVCKLTEALKIDRNKLLALAGVIPAALAETLKSRAKTEFGKRLIALRIRAGLAQNDLARIVGVSPSYLSKIEAGSKDPPSRKVLLRLADALGVNTNELMVLAGKTYRPDYKDKLIRSLKSIMKVPTRSIIQSRWATAAISLATVIAITALLWVAPTAKAVNISFSVPSSGTLGSAFLFTVKVDVQDTDLLPLQGVDLRIYNAASPTTNTVTFTDLPLTATSKNYPNSGGGPATITGATNINWGYATATSRYGYGYGYSSGTYGYGYGTGYGYGYGYGSYVGPASISYTVTWTPPSTWLAGTYKIKAIVYVTAGDTTTAFTNDTIPSFTLSAPSVGGGAPPAAVTGTGTVSLSGVINSAGVLTSTVTMTSSDSLVSLTIPTGTIGKTASGFPLSSISVSPVVSPPATPAGSNLIGVAYDFGPNGATFSPPIPLKFSYNPANIPAGVAETNLVVAFYDVTTGSWTLLTGVVDPVAHTITVSISHFSMYALMVQVPTRPTPAPTPTPVPPYTIPPAPTTPPPVTITPTPTPTPTAPAPTTPPPITVTPTLTPRPTPTPTTTPPGGSTGLIIGIIAAVIVVGIVVWLVMRRRAR